MVEFDIKARGKEQMKAVKIGRPGERAKMMAKHEAKRILQASAQDSARGAIEFESQSLAAVKMTAGLQTKEQYKREREGQKVDEKAAAKRQKKKAKKKRKKKQAKLRMLTFSVDDTDDTPVS